MAALKSYEVWDGHDKLSVHPNYDAAVKAAAGVAEPIIVAYGDGVEQFRVYRDNGIWWQEYSNEGRRRDVSNQMASIGRRQAGEQWWTA